MAHVDSQIQEASDEVKEQVFKNVMNCLKILTTSAFVVGSGNLPIGSQSAWPSQECQEKAQNPAFLFDIWKMTDIEYISSQKVSPKKKRDRIATGPKGGHVPTEAEREHWISTWYLQDTNPTGADPVATTKHLSRFAKGKKWHREHFCRLGSNTSTQPQTSSSQWQDCSGWQYWTASRSSSKKVVKE